MLLLTILFIIILTILSYSFFDRDVLAPPTVVCLGFLFASLCAYYNEDRWGLAFSSNTMWVIVFGLLAFIVGGIFAFLTTNIRQLNRIGFCHKRYEIKPINIETSKTIIIIFFELFTIVLLYKELRKLTGATIWNDIVTSYRAETTRVNPEEITMSLSRICSLFISISFVIALNYSYVVGNNIAAHQKLRIIDWIPILLSTVLSFMQGYRSDMLRLWIAVLVVTFTLKNRKNGWKKNKETRKMIKIMALSVVLIAVVFVAMREFVGRDDTDKEAFYYLTFYAGSSIAALDVFIKDPLSPSEIWGKETFYSLNQSIGARFNIPELRYIFYKEFRTSPNGTYLGNIYTALRPPYYDFGFVGMILVMLIMGFLFAFLYCKCRTKFGKSKIDFRLLMYSYVAYTFFMYFYNCYNTFISFGIFRIIIEMLIVRWFLVGWHFKRTVRIKLKSVTP